MTAGSAPSRRRLPRIRIDREGTWYAEGGEITHGGVLANLRSNLRVDARGHYLQVGSVRIPVEVEDAPFVVLRVEPAGRDGLRLTLDDFTEERLDPATLRFDAQSVPRCRVKRGTFAACFSRPAAWQLLQHVEYDEAARRATLVLGGVRYPLEGLAGPAGPP